MCETVDYLTCATPVWQSNTTCADLQDKLYESVSCMMGKNCSQSLLDYWCDVYETNNYTAYEPSGSSTVYVNLIISYLYIFRNSLDLFCLSRMDFIMSGTGPDALNPLQ